MQWRQVAEWESFVRCLDPEYALCIARKMEKYACNPSLGYRTAGSQAERRTGDFLFQQMQDIGLSDVRKDEFRVDSWTFHHAKLTYTDQTGETKTCELGSYQTDFHTQGPQRFSLVYADRATDRDFSNLDVTGKLVLARIDQRSDWWINYPAYQAHRMGAAALIVWQHGGYGQVDPQALNAQNIGGPSDAPAFSISQADAEPLMRELERQGSLEVVLDAESSVTRDGTSSNIIGTIPGEDPDSLVLLSAHYDSYFRGFQDDNTAVGMLLALARALLESGYRPHRTLVFAAMAAEEWGVSDTRYDWSTGAYSQVFRVRPDWQGKVIANLNVELPAYRHGERDELRCVYQLKTFLNQLLPLAHEMCQAEPVGGLGVVAPLQTWSDDFSISLSGIPALVNDFSSSEFMSTHYHSQFDNERYFDEEVYRFHHALFGLLAMAFDRCAAAPLDTTPLLDAMEASVRPKREWCADYQPLLNAIQAARVPAERLYSKVMTWNQRCCAVGDGKGQPGRHQEGDRLSRELLRVFRFCQDSFVRLTWHDRVVFPHDQGQSNVYHLTMAIKALEKGNAAKALEEHLRFVDNNEYAMGFDREVCRYFTEYALYQPAERLMWGAGRMRGQEDLYDVVRSLMDHSGMGQNWTKQLAELKEARKRQIIQLQAALDEETVRVRALGRMLEELCLKAENLAK